MSDVDPFVQAEEGSGQSKQTLGLWIQLCKSRSYGFLKERECDFPIFTIGGGIRMNHPAFKL